MIAAAGPLFAFDNTFARDLVGLYHAWQPSPVPTPTLLVLNDHLAEELGADPDRLRSDDGVAALCGNALPLGAEPLAQAYAGHQFGGYSPRLGDGRALLLGEVIDVHGRRRDLQLKGSGPTPFARGGDGKAAVGPMLREHLIAEAMHALGIPTTRALAVVATGEGVIREGALPGAVLARVAASHLRIGTFQFAAATGDRDLLRRLSDYAITRHHPELADDPRPALALLERLVDVHSELTSRWMLVGFIHGVMNTDNLTISGETIDYGPCAFMDAFDPRTVFSSIDEGGRYAYGNQPRMALWGLSRLAEALLPLIDDDTEVAVAMATDVLQRFPERYGEHFGRAMRAKLGLRDDRPDDPALTNDLLELMHHQHVDMTSGFRSLSAVLLGDGARARALFDDPSTFEVWASRWLTRLASEGHDPVEVARSMDELNPIYVPRNHLVEEALTAATAGDLGAYERLLEVVSDPFTDRPGRERYAQPAPASFGPYRTFCGT